MEKHKMAAKGPRMGVSQENQDQMFSFQLVKLLLSILKVFMFEFISSF
jgi:hypothetical protein